MLRLDPDAIILASHSLPNFAHPGTIHRSLDLKLAITQRFLTRLEGVLRLFTTSFLTLLVALPVQGEEYPTSGSLGGVHHDAVLAYNCTASGTSLDCVFAETDFEQEAEPGLCTVYTLISEEKLIFSTINNRGSLFPQRTILAVECPQYSWKGT